MEKKVIKLDEIEKRNPFKVPENYFADFNQEIMNKLPEKKAAAPKQITLWERVKPWIYMAAMFVGFYFLINLLVQHPPKENSGLGQSASVPATPDDEYWSKVKVTEEELFQYIQEQIVSDGYYDFMYNQVGLN